MSNMYCGSLLPLYARSLLRWASRLAKGKRQQAAAVQGEAQE